jgi:hypothetical protein
MKAENRHYTKKWKVKRKNHLGDKCRNSKCVICSAHKSIGNNKNAVKKKYKDKSWRQQN